MTWLTAVLLVIVFLFVAFSAPPQNADWTIPFLMQDCARTGYAGGYPCR